MATSMHYGAKKATFQFTYQLRKNLTPAEKSLWGYLSKRSLGLRFKCQHPAWIYVLDFYCHPLQLAIEVDGSIHLLEEIHQNDVDRETNLKSFGITIIRFTNNEVLNNIEHVLERINSKTHELYPRFLLPIIED